MNILLLWETLTFASAIFESVRNELDRFYLFIFADDFVNKKMRQSFIGCKLHLFGVNKDKPQLFGRIFVNR